MALFKKKVEEQHEETPAVVKTQDFYPIMWQDSLLIAYME